MKNGPVFSNITMINKCFSDTGSPLPYSMILDYLCMNWANGRGINKNDANKFLDFALNADYYYIEISPQHYQRRVELVVELDSLYENLKETYIPIKYNHKKAPFSLSKLYTDTRFSIITTDDNVNYILLSEWNLLNDLAVELLNNQLVKQPTINRITQLLKDNFDIEDKNALFIPHIDNRFILKKDGTITLSELGYSNIDFDLKVEITTFIREEIARTTAEIMKILKNNIGIQLHIRTIIKEIYKLEIHRSAYPAYFHALKEYLTAIPDIYFEELTDNITYLPKEISPDKIDTFRLSGNTNKEIMDTLINMNSNLFNLTNQIEDTVILKSDDSNDDKLVYTLRYYDRVQETLTATFFIKWIMNNTLKVQVLDDEIDNQYIFFYDKRKNILYGSQLEEFMCDYALEPGQKLEFTSSNDKIYINIGKIDSKAAVAQERYLDIGRISLENTQKNKSIMQLVAETLIYHPSGLHISEITKYVVKNSFCAESSVSSTLSTYSFFQKHPKKIGFWVFNPTLWKKSDIEKSIKTNSNTISSSEKFNNKIKKMNLTPVVELEEIYKKIAYDSKIHKNRIRNNYFKSCNKEKLLISAWYYYSFLIYNLAINFSTPAVTPMDLIQESYFALNKAYENYDVTLSNSFYHYCQINLKSKLTRYIGDKKDLIRIPIHKTEELNGILKQYEIDCVNGKKFSINKYDDNLTIWNIDYISFEQLYTYFSMNNTDTYIYDDNIRAAVSYPFLYPLDYEYRYDNYNKNSYNIIDSVEPENLYCPQLTYEDTYSFDSDLLVKVFKYIENRDNLRAVSIVKLRIGLTYSGKKYTLEEIGTKYNLTRERIRQIEKNALTHARYYVLRTYNKKWPHSL
ncbi:MAG: sigma factor-like helix-turn-helix DNA-binding protein [Clostridiaceae bacterium]